MYASCCLAKAHEAARAANQGQWGTRVVASIYGSAGSGGVSRVVYLRTGRSSVNLYSYLIHDHKVKGNHTVVVPRGRGYVPRLFSVL